MSRDHNHLTRAVCVRHFAQSKSSFSFQIPDQDREMIRAYIKNQELTDKQLDQMQLKLTSS